ncbi:related to bacterial aminoglycoside acetyltransferase regulators [Rhynchosporium agropyri]|uniref:Related to bacterial aminoglycoside acetyltransferase regulators n=1 Tax=Rhynchosporium agropyri TaxID=914238 RepID=A0A1E1JXM1_9HELO|nr:related to bacterial aminoglycoside acetyltransferase regulators [Rhynchosporium agropyri]
MKSFNVATSLARWTDAGGTSNGLTAWTCRRCLSQNKSARVANQFRGYAKKSHSPNAGSGKAYTNNGRIRRKGKVLAVVAFGGVGLTTLGFADQVGHAYGAVERSGRVASTLAVCINDYRVTLNQNEKTDNEDERNTSLKACHQRCADRTLKVLEKNGSIFIKLGQHLSAMNYLLPVEWTTTFIPLQDKCPVSSIESIEAMFERDTGEKLSDYFSEFDPVPIGAASLAQVHLATVKETGQKVAVKVQHPALAEWANLDLALTRFTFSTLKKFFPEYDLEWLSSEMEYSLPQELDFQLEGQNALRTKEYFSHKPQLPLVIPDVLWGKKRILVMENVSGHRPDDLAFLDANGIDRDEVSAALARIFNEMIFGDNAPLHCDPHGGNIAIRKNTSRRGANFDVILYDHGLYRDIPLTLRRSYAKLWLAVIDANEPLMRKYSKEVAGITDEQFPLFASAITGRDYRVLTKDVSIARSEEEKKSINDALGEGMLQQLVEMLGQVPRIILLILKTNDLTRSLDENLQTRQGPVRTFLILARYCSRTVFEEKVEMLRERGSLLWPSNFLGLLRAWLGYSRVEMKLISFETWLAVKRGLGAVVG